MFYLPISLFLYLLFHNFIIFPPHSLIPSFSTILIFSHLLLILDFPFPQFLLFSLLNLAFPPPQLLLSSLLLHLLIYSLYFSIHKYIDPTSTLDWTYCQHCFVTVELYTTATTFLFPTTTTTTNTTFLLFSLHHHHISIVFIPPIVFLPDRPK